jgi:hypothetical protein
VRLVDGGKMSKKVRSLVLLLWIGTTLLLDLLLGTFSLPLVAFVNLMNAGVPYAEDSTYNLPLHSIVLNQVITSLLVLLFGLVWSSIVLMSSERLLLFLKFPTAQNNKFSGLSLNLFKLALLTVIFTVLIGNISLIYDQIQGRGLFKAN